MKSKYKNIKVTRTVNNEIVTFDSKREAKRYDELWLLAVHGKIEELTLQPKYELLPKFKHEGVTHRPVTYVADFRYIQDGETIVEDVKGMLTDVYRIKKKLFLKRYGKDITFKEIF